MNSKRNTDFAAYGTFRAVDGDMLKRELEKSGIPVKMLYPGTSIGRDTFAGAQFTAYQLMIRVCDFELAERVREKFHIKAMKTGEKMPLPKTYKWAKSGLNRIFLIGYALSVSAIFAMSIIGCFFGETNFLPANIFFYLIAACFAFFFLWLFSSLYEALRGNK